MKNESAATEAYKRICNKMNIPKNNLIHLTLRSDTFHINVDAMRELDLRVLNSLFGKYRGLSSIKLWSKESNLSSKQASSTSRFMQSTQSSAFSSSQPENSKNPAFTQELLTQMSKVLLKSKSLTTLVISGLTVTPEGWKELAKGMTEKSNLSSVSIVRCRVTDDTFAILAPSLMRLRLLKSIDLSHNLLSDKSGYSISRIISKNTVKRDEEKWAGGLRGENAKVKSGLVELSLSNNSLGDSVINEICTALSHDRWLRVIDLSHNQVGNPGMNELISLIQINSSLFVVDVRGNEFTVPFKIYKAFVGKLRKNLHTSKENAKNGYEKRLKVIEAEVGMNLKQKKRTNKSMTKKDKMILNLPHGNYCKNCAKLEEFLELSKNYCNNLLSQVLQLRNYLCDPENTEEPSIDKIDSLVGEATKFVQFFDRD